MKLFPNSCTHPNWHLTQCRLKIHLFLILFFLGAFRSLNAQLPIFINDNFNRTNNTTVGNGWIEVETIAAGAQITSNQLRLGSGTTGREFVYQDISSAVGSNGLTNLSGIIEWHFKIRNSRTDPSGFDNGNYGMAFVLAKSTTDPTTGNGYAVVLGGSGTNDPIRLVRCNGGIDLNSKLTDIITGTVDYGNEYLSVSVLYNTVTDEWSMYAISNATAFPTGTPSPDFTQQVGSSVVNTTYTGAGNNLIYTGALWNHASGANENALFDDIVVRFNEITFYPRTNATDLSQASQWTTDAAGSIRGEPSNFSSPYQQFFVNDNVSFPTVNAPWIISNGSKLFLNNTTPFIFTPSSRLTIGSNSPADFNSKPVTLKSNASGTAAIGTINGMLFRASNVTVERYLSSLNNRAYRLLAPSVSTTTSIRSNWQENGNTVSGYGTHITGSITGANGFDATQTGNPSLYLYDAVTPAWQAIANTNATNLSATTGYLTFIRGDRTVDLNSTASPLPTTNTTLRATGSLLTGTQAFNLPTLTGFTLITNPYASAISWTAIKNANTGIESYYTFWDPNIGVRGGYVTVNANGNVSPTTSAGSTVIPSGLAFFVKSTGATGLLISEGHKTTATAGDVFRAGTQTESFSATLFYTDASNQRITADGVLAVYNNDYTIDYDEADATQIANWDEDVAISRNGSSLSIQSRPLIDATDTIRLSIARMKVQNYEWQFDAAAFNHPSLQAVLLDNFLNTRTPLSLTGQTIVAFSVTANSASSAAGRFTIVFEDVSVLPVRITNVIAQQRGKDVQVQWQSASDAEVREYQVEKSVDGRTFAVVSTTTSARIAGANGYQWLDVNPTVSKHYYRVKAIGTNSSVHYSPVVTIDLTGKASPVVVYPNPVKGDEVGLALNLPAGAYTLQVVNASGQVVHQQRLTLAGGAVSQTIQLPAIKGVYQITLSSAQSTFTQRLIKN